MEDFPIDAGEFVVVGPLWLVAPSPRPQGAEAVCKTLARETFIRPGGATGRHVLVFTDQDLARQFIESLGDDGRSLEAFTCHGPDDFAAVLQILQGMGETHLGFDSEPTHGRTVAISTVLDAIRRRRRP